MGKRNGFFQLVVYPNGTFIRKFPASNGGKTVELSEIIEYLNDLNISDYDIVKLKKDFLEVRDSSLIQLNQKETFPVDEMIRIRISEDKMSATGRFYPPSNKGKLLDRNQILKELANSGVKEGIDDVEIECFLNRREYCKDFILAKGKESEPGKDGYIEYFFNTDPKIKPKINSDGSVDFHDLNNISHIKKGDVLARLSKEIPGNPGFTVTGEIQKAKEVKKATLRYGKNVVLSEDKLSLISDVSGHATLIDDKVFVSNIYDVEADVDSSTGDIDYDGNVEIKGNVRSGFVVNATGNIEVNGVVEGATLTAGGDIILKRGIQGMGKGILKAKGNVVAKFIENAIVRAEGDLEAGSILHSNVDVKGEVNVIGRKGFVAGGTVRATSLITVKAIGSNMGTDTIVEVGVDPIMKERYQFLKKDIEKNEKEFSRLKPLLVMYGKKASMGEKFSRDKVIEIQKLANTCKEMEDTLKSEIEELSALSEVFELETSARIKVTGTIYPGVKLVISDSMLLMRDERSFCQFVREDGEIKIYSL